MKCLCHYYDTIAIFYKSITIIFEHFIKSYWDILLYVLSNKNNVNSNIFSASLDKNWMNKMYNMRLNANIFFTGSSCKIKYYIFPWHLKLLTYFIVFFFMWKIKLYNFIDTYTIYTYTICITIFHNYYFFFFLLLESHSLRV